MILRDPFKISAGLYPALHIGEAWLECREGLQFVVVFNDGHEHEIQGFRPGMGENLQGCFSAILSFFSAWAEALEYGEDSDNYDLFPPDDAQLREWAENNDDEICMMSVEIEETDDLITDTDDTDRTVKAEALAR